MVEDVPFKNGVYIIGPTCDVLIANRFHSLKPSHRTSASAAQVNLEIPPI